MDFDNTGIDVTSESSSETVEASPVSQGEESSSEAKAAPEPKEVQLPDFDKIPRFRELIEDRNQFKAKAQEYESQLKEAFRRLDELSKPKQDNSQEAELLNRLDKIDPVFAKYIRSMSDKLSKQDEMLSKFSQVEQRQQGLEQRSYLQAANSVASQVQAELKVSAELHKLVMSNIPMGTPVDQISAKYKEAVSPVLKLIEGTKREAVKDYSKAKTGDSKIPSATSKGNLPKQSDSKAPSVSRDPEMLKKEMVSRILKLSRASNEV